jgi:hypothetical protein
MSKRMIRFGFRMFFMLSTFFIFLMAQQLQLLQTFDPGLPESGRNGSGMGRVVANIGDVNGDNYDDWAVGIAWCADIVTSKKVGKVYIYLGSAAIVSEQDPALILQGEADNDQFGSSIAAAGDVNGDGFDDLIIGAFNNDQAGANAGKAYIYYGAEEMDNIPDVVMTGEAEGDHFGISVSPAGDVNGDTFADVLIGASGNDEVGENAGSAYIYYGGTAMDSIPDIILTGEAADDYFGNSVSAAGNVNNDDYDDVLIGARWNDTAASNAGRAYIYFGGSAMDDSADVLLTGEAANDYFGNSVSAAGDMNNDTYDDVIVGADRNDNGGSAYVYFGGAAMDSIADLKFTAEEANEYFGQSVSSAGDVNGDNHADVIVGAAYYGQSVGRAYIYFGGAQIDLNADVILTGIENYDYFGDCVSLAGDVNGDNYDDVIVGAYGNDTGGSGSGRVYIYYGSSQMDNTVDRFFTGEKAYDWFGSCVASAGDVNGDDFTDLIMGSSLYGNVEEKTYIYFGGSVIDSTEDVIFTGEAPFDYFGSSVSSAGDVNNDNFADVVIGAPSNGAGKAYLYYGGSNMDNLADLVFSGKVGTSMFGCSVASAGDVNGDGYGDIIIGATGDGDGYGRAYIYYGGFPVMDSNADVGLLGITDNSNFGYSVAAAGDVNGDGFDDVIVGAYLNSSIGINAGRAFIYFGSAEMDSIIDLVLIGEIEDDNFGRSVASAGDVNHDGYADVIVGAPENQQGRAYIYFGGLSMDNAADVVLKGENIEDIFGGSVCSAGDLNRDGYDDVVIGALEFDAALSNEGRAYIYFGGAAMDTLADVILTGDSYDDNFGCSVAIAGDVNGDDVTEIIVGAYGNCAVGNYMGKAYLYSGSGLTTIERKSDIRLPAHFSLAQNYPNPFNPSTTIRYRLAVPSKVTIIIYDIIGREVKRLIDGEKLGGDHQVVWDGKNAQGVQVSSGIYFYRMVVKDKKGEDLFSEARRLLLIK